MTNITTTDAKNGKYSIFAGLKPENCLTVDASSG
jgi:hypothetical protein